MVDFEIENSITSINLDNIKMTKLAICKMAEGATYLVYFLRGQHIIEYSAGAFSNASPLDAKKFSVDNQFNEESEQRKGTQDSKDQDWILK